MNLPSTSLVPRIPQRLNYLLLIEDLLKANQLNRDVLGVDIGNFNKALIYNLHY